MAKCKICKKKIRLSMISVYTCKCGKKFCSTHYANHDCTYDYKKEERERLAETLILVQPGKINKI